MFWHLVSAPVIVGIALALSRGLPVGLAAIVAIFARSAARRRAAVRVLSLLLCRQGAGCPCSPPVRRALPERWPARRARPGAAGLSGPAAP